jgi:hypothetical protein
VENLEELRERGERILEGKKREIEKM